MPRKKKQESAVVWEPDPTDVLRAIIKHSTVSVDLETNNGDRAGLDPHHKQAKIGVCILHVDKTTYVFRAVPSWIPLVFADGDIKKRIFNAQYDLRWLIKHAGVTQVRNLQDLYLDELLVSDHRRGVKHDLQATLRRRLGVEISKDMDHNTMNWCGELDEQAQQYVTEDVQYMDALGEELERMVKLTGQERGACYEHGAVFGVASMALNGLPIDRHQWGMNTLDWAVERTRRYQELRALWPDVENWESGHQIKKAALNHLGIVIPSTRKDMLRDLSVHWPIFKSLAMYRLWNKRLNDYGTSKKTKTGKIPPKVFCQRFINPNTGRIHPSLWQIGTDTCRMASSGPNGQQFPRDPTFRKGFRAGPDTVIASLDYGQIEVLCAAVYAKMLCGDDTLIRVYGSGGDFHRSNVATILGKAPADVSKDDRQLGKAVTFHALFGGAPRGLVEYAKGFMTDDGYPIQLSLPEAQAIQAKMWQAYPGLSFTRNHAYGVFDRRPSMVEVRNLIGVRRILTGEKLKPTTYLNTIIQSTAAYGIKAAIARLVEYGFGPYLLFQVHDEILFEFPKDKANDLVALARACMVAGMRDVLGSKIPVNVDVAMGATWL